MFAALVKTGRRTTRRSCSCKHAFKAPPGARRTARGRRRRRRRHRRRRRPRWLRGRLPPGPGRPRRPAAGEDRVPAREGLRRRPHPAGGQERSSRMGIDTSAEAGWLHNKGLRIIGGGHAPRAALARPRQLPRLRPGPAPGSTSTSCWPAPRRRPARGCRSRPTSPARCSTPPAAWSASPPRSVGPATVRRTARRWCSPPTASPPGSLALGHAQARRPADGRRRPPLLHQPAPRRRHPRVLAGAWDAPTAATCCPATAGSSASATARPTSASASSTPPRPSADVRLPQAAAPLARAMPPEWRLRRGHATGPIRGAALPMGFNRQPHYTPRPAARRRRRRHGQPVQRRGHRLRDGVRRAGRRGRRPGAGPAGRADPRAGAAGLPRRAEGAYGGYYTLGRVFVKLIGNPRVMKLATRHGLPRPTAHEVHAEAARQPHRPRGGDAMDRVINGLTKVAPAA